MPHAPSTSRPWIPRLLVPSHVKSTTVLSTIKRGCCFPVQKHLYTHTRIDPREVEIDVSGNRQILADELAAERKDEIAVGKIMTGRERSDPVNDS